MKIHEKVRKKLSDLYHANIVPRINSSRAVECPFCRWTGPEFLTAGVERRKNSRCPKCDSMERHRLYYLYLKKVIPRDRKIKVLHFAPEKIIMGIFKSYPNIEYLSADLDPNKAMVKEDITQISFVDKSFDIIFCSHVLEHIPDDIQAMRELHRVLTPTGFAIIQVPIKDSFNGIDIITTYEDPNIIDPADRRKEFGQHDHVRVYGRDYKERLIQAGFTVQVIPFIESLPPAEVKRYALLTNSPTASETDGWVYHCTR
jgi:SAM-dependent methyltransferase